MTQRKRKLIIIGTILLVLIIALHKGWGMYVGMKKAEYMANMKTPVEVATATNENWQSKIQATGTLNAQEGIMLKSEVAGRITKIYFQSGQTVKAGDPLLDIDPGMIKAQLAAAIAHANLTSGDYGRAIELFKRGALSKQDMDTALANKQADAAQVQSLQSQLAQNEIKAPISGTLGIKLVTLGAYVTQGQQLVNLQSTDPMRVDFSVPENDIEGVHVGDKVTLISDTAPNQTFTGAVSAIDSAVNVDTRTVAVRAKVPNPNQKLIPGAFAQITLYAGSDNTLVSIPQIAVVYDSNGDYVYKVVKGKAVKTPIKVLQQNKHQVAVQGLQNGDVVVTQGQLKIYNGANVNATH